jgi:hypothetical protein
MILFRGKVAGVDTRLSSGDLSKKYVVVASDNRDEMTLWIDGEEVDTFSLDGYHLVHKRTGIPHNLSV